MDPASDIRVYVHEIAHVIEGQTGQTATASKALRFANSSNQETAKLKTGEKSPFDDDEISLGKAWPGFSGVDAIYVNKYYKSDRLTEVVSMGLENLYVDPVKMAKENPDYFDFLINVLAGSYAK